MAEAAAQLLGLESDSEEEDEELTAEPPLAATSKAPSPTPDSGVEEQKGNAGDDQSISSEQTGVKIVTRHQGLSGRALAAGFSEKNLSLASDKFREAWSRVQSDQWDIKSWQTLLSEAQTQRSGRGITLSDVYRLCLKQFPTNARFWKDLAEYELRQGNMEAVDEIFMECLLDCPSIELWQLYITRIRKGCSAIDSATASREEVDEHRANMTKAYEFALLQIGIAVDAAPLWWDYINFVRGWRDDVSQSGGGALGESAVKITTLRKIYQRAVAVPLDGLDEIWRSYEAWERNLNEHNAKQVLPSLQSIFNNAKSVARERRLLVEAQRFSRLAVPPQGTAEDKQQLSVLRRRIDFEKSNPEHVDPSALKDRMRLAYRTSLAYFYRFPEVWQDFAKYELDTDDVEAACSLYERAVEAVPDCLLLHMAYAELLEKLEKAAKGVELLKAFVEREPCTLGYIFYQSYVRRTQGKQEAREVFRSTKELRKKGTLTYHYYLAHARMEMHMNQEVDTARRVLEYALRQHPEYLQEVEFVSEFAELLIRVHDDKNFRGLCDRALAAVGPSDKAKPLWKKLLAFEVLVASDQDIRRVEQVQERMQKAYPHEKEPTDILRLWRRYSVFQVKPTTEADELLMSRYGVMEEKEEKAKAEAEGGKDDAAAPPHGPTSRGGDRGGGRRRDDSVLTTIQQRRLQGIPECLRKLYVMLPQHVGPPPDVDTIIRSLRDHALPAKPAGPAPPPKPMPEAPPVAPPPERKRKRSKWGPVGGESDNESDDDRMGGGGQTSDIFRSRQQDKVLKGYS